MFTLLRFKNSCLFFIMGWIPLLGACTQPMDSIVNAAVASDEAPVNVEKSIARIDAALPDRFETASFGLG